MIKNAELIAIYGARGSGKTTRTKILLRDRSRVIVFDPTGEYGREHGFPSFTDGAKLRAYVAKRWGGSFRAAYVPQPASEPECLHALATFALAAQRPYLDGRDRRVLTLVVEEMNLGYPHGLPRQLDGMPRICNQGRHSGIEVIGVTQRPPLVALAFRGNVSETWIYPLAWAADREPILAMIGRQYAGELAALRPHQYLRYRMGAVEKGENPAPRKR